MYPTSFTEQNKKFVLSLHYNDDDSYLFVSGVQQYKFKGKNSEIARNVLCLGNISTQFSITNRQKAVLHGSIYDFSLDYWLVNTTKIYDIHRYLMKKTILYKMFRLIKKIYSSILFLLVSVVLTRLFVCFYVNLQSKRNLQDYY